MTTAENPSALTRLILEKAASLGFQKVGVVSARIFQPDEAQRLRQWVERNYQAEMAWMVNHLDKRLDPTSLMEDTRSIICVGMNYYNPDAYDINDPNALKIAKYARGTDYHYVIKDRLKELLAYIQTLVPDAQGRALTDSAPIWEKPLALKSGLGWLGKNGNLLTQNYGSWLFLGELLLDIELEETAAEPLPNLCGNCRRCIDACPTDAIVENGTVDANRCISYWTIEFKGEQIPATIAENLNGWIFGCDICQDVCPWNIRFARETEEDAFQPRPWNRELVAAELLELDEETFRERYRKSPVKRAKLAGFQRNVKAAINRP